MDSARWKGHPFLLMCLFALHQGCSVLPEPYLVSGPEPLPTTANTVRPCEPNLLERFPTDIKNALSPLDPAGFNLMNWNMLKGRRQGWRKDFFRLSRGSDVILLQEAYLSDELRNTLSSAKSNWNLATSVRYYGRESGVLTASEIAPEVICVHRFDEPLLNTPKTSLFTRFSILPQQPHLVIVNVHAINFTIDAASYRKYWQELEIILEPHNGPLIVAGDFNTWNTERLAIVTMVARRLRLQPVRFEPDRRSRFFGQIVDHVYYRGLVPSNAVVHEVATSDHNPIQVNFKLVEANSKEVGR
ncbi:MAG: endonuclease/exonuclease/phosphatase family protein [Desulfobacterales bacterium]|jgi:endonuclease/exonuclease/phosphatase (EEP) superfamily protein YafD